MVALASKDGSTVLVSDSFAPALGGGVDEKRVEDCLLLKAKEFVGWA